MSLSHTSGYVLYRFRKAGYQAIDRICDYYYSLEKQNVVSSVEPGYLRAALPRKLVYSRLLISSSYNSLVAAAAPEVGENFQKIADDYQQLIVPGKYMHMQFDIRWYT